MASLKIRNKAKAFLFLPKKKFLFKTNLDKLSFTFQTWLEELYFYELLTRMGRMFRKKLKSI